MIFLRRPYFTPTSLPHPPHPPPIPSRTPSHLQTKTENYEMPNQTFSLGRATKNDLVVSRYTSISRKHVEMAVSEGACQMTVLGAAGTQVF